MADCAELRDVLLLHQRRYPKLQIQDLVKLVFQNEFAGGHMIADAESSLQRLRAECQALVGSCSSERPGDVFLSIGNGLCRLDLAAISGAGVQLTTVNQFFVNTARSRRGDLTSFERKLELLRDCCQTGQLPHVAADLEAFLLAYRAQGYPAVSHSVVYRDHYKPAYQVVDSVHRDFFALFCRIDGLLESQATVCVAIDGPSGAGKSTLAALLGQVYNCNIFHMDDFSLPPELKTEERLAEAGGNVDYLRFRQEVVGGLQTGREFSYRPYDCRRQTYGQPVTVSPKRLNVIEGVYSQHPALVDCYQLEVFLSVDKAEQLRRIERRNGPLMLKRFINEWIPLENTGAGRVKPPAGSCDTERTRTCT
ncbi:MAG: hypothetical protein VB144_08010 [Clostridia bacterium]|nr:hypothetical protein [Clostridia bacterium]